MGNNHSNDSDNRGSFNNSNSTDASFSYVNHSNQSRHSNTHLLPPRAYSQGSSNELGETQLALVKTPPQSSSEFIGRDGALFSSRPPRDAIAGISSGVQSAVKGVFGGIVSLIALPVQGAKEEGVSGFAKGTALGLTGAVVLPLTGSAVAVYQIGRGLYNTPSAILNSSNGLKWNKKTRKWEVREDHLSKAIETYIENPNPYLPHIENATPVTQARPENRNNRENIKVVDYEYYDILEVDVTATKEEIKRQYYKLAKQMHPDKNPNNEEAKERFQQLGRAYQVLSDDDLRAKYNEHGKDGTSDLNDFDMTALFTCLFGSEKLEPLVGKPATVFNIEYANLMSNSPYAEEFSEFEKKKRLTTIAFNLRSLITPYCSNDPREQEQWQHEMKLYAEELCQVSFGFAFLDALGWSYINTATQYLGELDTFLGYGGKYAKVKAKWRKYGNTYSTVRTAMNVAVSYTQASIKNKKREKSNSTPGVDENTIDPNKIQDLQSFEKVIAHVLEFLLNLMIVDLEVTVRKSCKRLLRDLDVPIETRRLRAEAIIQLGQIFQDTAQDWAESNQIKNKTKVDSRSARDLLNEAMIRVATKKGEEA